MVKKKNNTKISAKKRASISLSSSSNSNKKKKVVSKDHGKRKGIDKKTALELSDKGFSQQRIADILGCSQQNIQALLAPIRAQEKALKEFQDKEPEVLDVHRAAMLASLSPDVIANIDVASPRDVKDMTTAYAILKDKANADRGKAVTTFSMVSYKRDVATVERLQAELVELERDASGTYSPQDSQGPDKPSDKRSDNEVLV